MLERKQTIGLKPCVGGIVESVEPFDLPDYGMPRLDLLIKQKHKQAHVINWFEKVPMGLNLIYNLFFKAFKHKFISMES